MNLLKKLFLAFILQGYMQFSSFAELSSESLTACDEIVHTEIEHHPAGPVVRKTWTNPIDGLPYKIEIHNLRSGGFLLNGVKIFYENFTGNWYLKSEDLYIQLLVNNQSKRPNKFSIRSKGCDWKIKVTSEHLPKPSNGVATEEEANLDLVLLKQACS